jgi:hypothetical protein
LGKLSSLFQEGISNPNEFLNNALSSFAELIEPYGDWLNSEGVPEIENNRQELMELAKNQNLVNKAIFALESMLEQNWDSSSDIQQILQLHRVENLIRFYAKELPENSDEGIKARFMIQKLENQFNFTNKINSLIKSTTQHLDSLLTKNPTNADLIKLTKSTFEQMQLLYNNRENIASEKNQSERERKAQILTSAGVEGGFISGKNPAEALKRIEHRTYLLLAAFQKAQLMGKEDEFIKNIAGGDRCITARMGRVEEFFGVLNELGDFQQDLLTDHIFALSDVAIMNVIGYLLDNETITPEDISELTANDIDQDLLTAELKFLGNTNSTFAIPFKDYLVRMKFCENKENIDWNKTAALLRDSEDFKKMLKRGKDLASQSFIL